MGRRIFGKYFGDTKKGEIVCCIVPRCHNVNAKKGYGFENLSSVNEEDQHSMAINPLNW